MCLRLSEPTAWLVVDVTPCTLRHQLIKRAFIEGNGKKTSVLRKSIKSLIYTDDFLLSPNDYTI